MPCCAAAALRERRAPSEETARIPMQGIDPHAPVVRFHNVGMRYGGGPEVLRDISFTLARGAIAGGGNRKVAAGHRVAGGRVRRLPYPPDFHGRIGTCASF